MHPFVSSEDINKGQRWNSVIAEALQQCDFGVVCVTPENLLEPWLHFEAGAMTRGVSASHVAPLLINVTSTDLTGPLSQFQAAEVRPEEMFKVVKSINSCVTPSPLDEDVLRRVFDKWWPDLESDLESLNSTYLPSGRPARTDRELLEEILEYARRSNGAEPTKGSPPSAGSILGSEQSRVRRQITQIGKRFGIEVTVQFDRRYNLVNLIASTDHNADAEQEIIKLIGQELNMKASFQWQLPLEFVQEW